MLILPFLVSFVFDQKWFWPVHWFAYLLPTCLFIRNPEAKQLNGRARTIWPQMPDRSVVRKICSLFHNNPELIPPFGTFVAGQLAPIFAERITLLVGNCKPCGFVCEEVCAIAIDTFKLDISLVKCVHQDSLIALHTRALNVLCCSSAN